LSGEQQYGYRRLDSWTAGVKYSTTAESTTLVRVGQPMGGPSRKDGKRAALERLVEMLRSGEVGPGDFDLDDVLASRAPIEGFSFNAAAFEARFVPTKLVRVYEDSRYRRSGLARGDFLGPSADITSDLVVEVAVENRLPWAIEKIEVEADWYSPLTLVAAKKFVGLPGNSDAARRESRMRHAATARIPFVLLPGAKCSYVAEVSSKIQEYRYDRSEQRVRCSIFYAASEINADWVEKQLADLKSPDASSHLTAVITLGMHPCREAVDGLSEALRDEDKGVRREAAQALGRIGDTRAVPALINMLNGPGADELFFFDVRSAIMKIGPAAGTHLIASLEDDSAIVRARSAELLGELFDFTAVRGLSAAMRDKDAKVRGAAAKALGAIADRRAVPVLLRAAAEEDADVRREAITALGRIGDVKAIGMILRAAKDEEAKLREAAILALGGIGRNDPVIKEKLADSRARVEGFPFLSKSNAKRAEHVIRNAMKDPDPDVVRAAEYVASKVSLGD
jgi:HEAT repeat protein